jgi:hypothetical protein
MEIDRNEVGFEVVYWINLDQDLVHILRTLLLGAE